MCNFWLLTNRFLPFVFLPQKMFQVEEVNCICVDWQHGARTEYTQAVQNIRVVGAEIAVLIQGLSVKPCQGYILGGRGTEGAGRRCLAPRGSLGTHDRGGGKAWKPGSPIMAFPKETCNLRPSRIVLMIFSCRSWSKLVNLFEPQFPLLK